MTIVMAIVLNVWCQTVRRNILLLISLQFSGVFQKKIRSPSTELRANGVDLAQ
jgi:hypothetical protein